MITQKEGQKMYRRAQYRSEWLRQYSLSCELRQNIETCSCNGSHPRIEQIILLLIMSRSMPAALQSKLFILDSSGDHEVEWVEQATGIPSFFKQENTYKLTFQSEDENLPYIYELNVNDNVNFDRTEPKIITWTVIKENVEAALSFRDEGGANSFWYLIDEYQKKDSVQVQSGTKDHFVIEFKIPDPTKANLGQVLKQLEDIPYIEKRERISSIFLTKIDLLPALKKLFTTLEQEGVQKNRQSLTLFFQIMKIILNFGDCEVITELLSESMWKFTFGTLEYDPQFFGYPHRSFMEKEARFLEVVPIKHPDKLKLIHMTYRLEYVKECILAAHLDQTGLRTHTMIVLNNYKDILSFIFNPREKQYLNEIFNGLRCLDSKVYRLLSQICRIARNHDILYGTVQEVSKDLVFSNLSERQIYQILVENLSMYFSDKSKLQSLKAKPKSKLKTSEDLQTIVRISLEVILNSLDVNPTYFKEFCNSEKERILKYPVINFLFKRLNDTHLPEWQQFNKIMAILNDGQFPHPLNQVVQKMSIDLMLADEMYPVSAIEILNKLCEASSSQLLSRLDQIISKIFTKLIPHTRNKSCLRITILQAFKKLIGCFASSNKRILMQSLLTNLHSIITILKQTKARNSMQLSVILQGFRLLVKNGETEFLECIVKSLSSDKSQISVKLIRDIEHVLHYKESEQFHFKRERSDIRLGEENLEAMTHKKHKTD